MPRRKTHSTKEARRKADRLKAARHYAKNKDTINAKRRESRQQQLELERQQNLSRARTELEKRVLEQKEQKQGSTFWQSHPIHRVREISQSISTLTVVSPTEYLESLYQDYCAWVAGPRNAPSPLESPGHLFDNMIAELNRLSSALLEQYGNGQYYTEVEAVIHQTRSISSSIDDIQLAFYDDCLEEKHMTGKLKYQSSSRVINGTGIS